MIVSSIEKLAESIGYDIGMSTDETQAKLLNGLCDALSNSMSDHHLDLQICYIVKHLSSKSCKVIKSMSEFIDLKDQK